MIQSEIILVIKKRKRIADETQDEWDYGIDKCWNEETEILSREIADTVYFFESQGFIAEIEKRAARVKAEIR